MRFKSRALALIYIVPLLLCGTTDSYAKKMYRWVDENGRVFFSDVVPPDQVQHKRETINENARVLDVVEKAKTPEELAQQKRLDALRKEQEKIIAKQAADDKVLLSTYRSLDDMNKALDNKLALMDSEKKMIEGNRRRMEQQLLQQQQQAANLERNAQKVPDKLLKEIASTRQQIEQNIQEMARHESNRQSVEKAFRADIARFAFLTQADENQKNQPSSVADNAVNELGLFTCQDADQCDKAWKIAGEFVYKFATTGRDVENEKLIMTAAPFNDDDLSLSVSRLEKGGIQQIFLDLRCKDSNMGKELCDGEKAQAIRRGFTAYVQLQLASQ
ncbi:DUF4124 domain-containing protein [Methylomonas methanica]|uniref:DUF4124 domain-containing protein n=1 Tax=Methylomonas methanica (strain DSM 25384 / MC09) TaxID=857087 RepID=G0A670_METMM|nr:DUF4124 domain-containing protein [Methylomonas methanica]AEG01698.1 hypothetical protein Metme_3327 [Methylomonas methanica MC09]